MIKKKNLRGIYERQRLRNRYGTLQNIAEGQEEEEVDVTWKQINTLYSESTKETVGYRKRKANKDWIQQETFDATEKRKGGGEQGKASLQAKSPQLRARREEEFREAKRKVKRLAGRDKREAMGQLAPEAGESAPKGEQGKVLNITWGVCGKFKGNPEEPVKDNEGKLVTTEKEQEDI